MSQVKIYGLLSSLAPVMRDVSDVIQSWVVDAMHYPPNRREHVCFRWNGRNSSKEPAHDLAASRGFAGVSELFGAAHGGQGALRSAWR